MGLPQPKTETVHYPGGEFAVRGLSFEDISVLVREYYPALETLWTRYVTESTVASVAENTRLPDDLSDIRGVIMDTLEIAPGLVATIIARASGEPDNLAAARAMGAGIQIDAITRIVTLTLESEGGPGNLMERLSGLANGLTRLNAKPSP